MFAPFLSADTARLVASQVPDIRAMACTCRDWSRVMGVLPDIPRWRLIVQDGKTETSFAKYGIGKMRDWSPHDIIRAAKYGNMNLVQYLAECGRDIHILDDRALCVAAKYGHLQVVQYLVERGANICAGCEAPLRGAASNGHLAVVQYLLQPGASTADALYYALDNCHFALVRYLVELGAPFDNDVLSGAVRAGRLDIVQYLVEHSANIHTDSDLALTEAATAGHLDVVQYLVEQGANVNINGLVQPADGLGCLDIAQYLVEHSRTLSLRRAARLPAISM